MKKREEFLVLNYDNVAERKLWVNLWNESCQREVYLHPEYVNLYSGNQKKAKCACFIGKKGNILYPFLQRSVCVDGYVFDKECYDIVTPYGYGGPQYCGDRCFESEQVFWLHFGKWVESNNIICELIRFSLFDDQIIQYPGKIDTRNLHVVCNLQKTESEIWADYKHKVRTNINKAKDNNIKVEVDADGEQMDHFYDMYCHTMDRNNAKSMYYFSKQFFFDIVNHLQRLVHPVFYRGQLLYLYDVHGFQEKDVVLDSIVYLYF